MNTLHVRLEYIQHIVNLALEIDLSAPGLVCLVGRNGTGKTTLVRALRNLSSSDTFVRTATPYAFSPSSRITYEVDGTVVVRAYDESIRSLNCREEIPSELRGLISAELPMPHGARFNYFKSASEADLDIRRAITLGTSATPSELIEFLNTIYGTTRYSSMVEVAVKGKRYYAIVNEDDSYIREDYLSSGEYFLINLYRTISGSAQLIIIDEIDISLDAAAQANLSDWLRKFCVRYARKILFTTHSLAIMRQLEASELFYIDHAQGVSSVIPASYSYAKARMFGFSGWDKYILTEDEVLLDFIEAIINRHRIQSFFQYKIIYIGGARQVISLMERNQLEQFLSSPENVITILDGDQAGSRAVVANSRVYTIPLESVEKDLYSAREDDTSFPFNAIERTSFSSAKDFYRYIQDKRIATKYRIFEYLLDRNQENLRPIVEALRDFLAPRF
jgi:ABC-type cobalamin/Fe3+-siderophores transport system ATPase subunit